MRDQIIALGEGQGWRVLDILAEMGIHYDCVIRYKGRAGIQHYFMRGVCEVAYFTPLTGILHINAEPRRWCFDFLYDTIAITDMYPRK